MLVSLCPHRWWGVAVQRGDASMRLYRPRTPLLNWLCLLLLNTYHKADNSMEWFYDNIGDNSISLLVKIDRIYCFLFDSFDEEHWAVLSEIYAALPGPRYQEQVSFRYGQDESSVHLSVSVEPVGLQAAGLLTRPDWLNWDKTFCQLVENSSLPRYELS
jgi:hypothetical protein